MSSIRAAVAAVLLCASCFSLEIPTGLLCGADNACPSGQTCTAGRCGLPVEAPDATPADACTTTTTCTLEGAECGTIFDGCQDITCAPGCTLPETCAGGGSANNCGCTPRTCVAQGLDCGTATDTCFDHNLPCGDCTRAGDVCGGLGAANVCTSPEMRAIAKATFTIGCDVAADPACEADERPAHAVQLDTFRIDETEVTQTAYQACVAATVCTAPSAGFTPGATPNRPVVGATWDQAAGYCAFVGKRLPTEAEWEVAARGSDGRIYPWGNSAPTCSEAIFSVCGGSTARDVGTATTGNSPSGAKDMAGNAAEWVADWYDPNYYASSPATNPRGPGAGTLRGVRGGGFTSTASLLRASNREGQAPSSTSASRGFRCAR